MQVLKIFSGEHAPRLPKAFYSAAVERLFGMGKDILKPGRCGLSDNHFNMLSFLKGNLNCYYCISAYRIKIALLFGFT